MTRRLIALTAATVVALGLTAAPALGHTSVPHPHSLWIGGVSPSSTCVDLAGGRDMPLQAHHDNVHAPETDPETGRGINVRGIRQAGHAVVPFTCEQVRAFFPS